MLAMFESTRIKLTTVYLLIIMCVSIFFSAVIYRSFTAELNRSLRVQGVRLVVPGPQSIGIGGDTGGQAQFYTQPDTDIVLDAKRRLLLQLTFINMFVAILSSIIGYFLAGLTLKPIQEAHNDQRRFIADASHELRTPLTSLKTELEVNLRDKNISATEARKVLESNLEEVNKLQSLANYLLSFNRYDELQAHQFKKVVLAKVFEEARMRVAKQAEAKEIEITLPPLKPEFAVHGHDKALADLFVILLDNSIKYSEPKAPIAVRFKTEGVAQRIEIEDHGIGIKQSDVPYIFNRFFRADSSRSKEKTTGYGLGLAMAKRIVELHHGTIEVHSEMDKGTTMVIYLPINNAYVASLSSRLKDLWSSF